MRTIVLLSIAALIFAIPANAAVIFSDDFSIGGPPDAENRSPVNWDVWSANPGSSFAKLSAGEPNNLGLVISQWGTDAGITTKKEYAVTGGTTLNISIETKSEGWGWHLTCLVKGIFKDASGNSLGEVTAPLTDIDIGVYITETTWTTRNVTMAVPAGAASAKFQIVNQYAPGTGNGAIWLDNLAVTSDGSVALMAGSLFWKAYTLEQAGKLDEALAAYQQVISAEPESPYAGINRAAFRAKYMKCMLLANADLGSSLDDAVAKLTADYKSSGDLLANSMFEVAAAVYRKGIAVSEKDPEGAKAYFAKSAELFESHVISKLSDTTMRAVALYLAGMDWDAAGQYSKAAGAFEKSYENDSKFRYADYCLLAKGRCYEKLLGQKLITETDAKSCIAAMYSQLLSKHPESKYAPYAQGWLEKNSK